MIPSIFADIKLFQSSEIMPPYTGDIDYGIFAAIILIALFVMYVVIKNRRNR